MDATDYFNFAMALGTGLVIAYDVYSNKKKNKKITIESYQGDYGGDENMRQPEKPLKIYNKMYTKNFMNKLEKALKI